MPCSNNSRLLSRGKSPSSNCRTICSSASREASNVRPCSGPFCILFSCILSLPARGLSTWRFLEQRTIRIDTSHRRQLFHHTIHHALDHHIVFEVRNFPTIRVAPHRQFDWTITHGRRCLCSLSFGCYGH